MALLGPILNNGGIYANTLLHFATQYVDDVDINEPFGIEIQFFSPTDEFVGMVGTTYDRSNLVGLNMRVDKIGDLNKLEFSIPRTVDIPFYNQMECRVHINGNYWYSAELVIKPNEDRSDPDYVYEANGWSYYFDEIKITKLYQNKTLEEILQDLIENEIATETPILYNPDLINPPSFTVTKLEFKRKTVKKALKSILEIANLNYATTQYRYGVNKDKQFFFESINTEIQRGFFEGFDYQNPEVKENLRQVINQVDIYRAKENSQDVEFIEQRNNTESQGLYGKRNRDLTISDFVDTTTARRIADAIIDRYKDPVLEVEVEDLNTEDTPYEIGFYNVNNRRNDYTKIINEFEDTNDWTITAPNTTITDTQEKVLSGKRSFKVVTSANSAGEVMEYTLEEQINFPASVSFYFSQSDVGEVFYIELESDEGNTIRSNSEDALLLEDGGYILLEDGGKIITENDTTGVDSRLKVDFQKYTFSASALDNIVKVRIYFVATAVYTLYFDRLDVLSSTYNQNYIAIDRVTYAQEGNTIISKVIFGEEIFNAIRDIKKIDDKAINVVNIFQKS